jgi:uncharacterized UPF0146 family protein
MPAFVVRIWLPDRPGALGQVASRIGAVRGDVVGIDILERDGGQAVDELVVELPRDDLIEPLVAEVRQVDGVAVEEVRRVADALHDPRLDALEAAAQIVAADDPGELFDAVALHARRVVGASWVATLPLDPRAGESAVLAADIDAPNPAWLEAFVAGSRAADDTTTRDSFMASDVLWAPLPCSGLALVLGRQGMPYRARERRQAAALARIADTRLYEIDPARRHAEPVPR